MARDLDLAVRVSAVDRFSAVAGRIEESADRLGKKLAAAQDKVAKASANFDRQVSRAGNLALVGNAVEQFGDRMVNAVERPVRQAMAFEDVMADVRKVVNFDSPEQFQQMQRDIVQLSREIPLTAAGFGEIVAAAGQAGIAREELKGFAADAAKMAVAFDILPERAGGAMTGLRTQFQLNQSGAVRLGDAINHLSNNMDATAASTLNVVERISGQARLFGLSAEQATALSASMLALKVRPEVAATSIEGMLRILQTADMQSKRFQDTLGRLGLSAEGLKESIGRDAQGALFELLETVREAEDPAGALAGLFGAEYGGDLAKLALNLGTYRKAVGLVASEHKFAGSMQAEFAERSKTASNAMQLLQNRTDALTTTIGDSLLPKITELAPKAGAVVDWFTTLAEENRGLTVAVAGTTAAMGFLGKVTGPVLSAAGGLLTAAAWMQLRAAKLQLASAGRGVAGDIVPGVGGTRGVRGRATEAAKGLGGKIKGAGGGLAKALKGRLGLLGAGLTALSIGSTLLGDETAAEKTRSVSGDVGALAGAIGGAKLGALLGTAVFPGAGTAVGGLLGSLLGGAGGYFLGGAGGEAIAGAVAAPQPALAGAGDRAPLGGVVNHGATTINNDNSIGSITVNQQPGEDGEALAKRVMSEIEEQRRERARDADYDEI